MISIHGLTDLKEIGDSKLQLLRHLRMIAEGDFGFGELLHLCLRSAGPLKFVCIASAVILKQTRPDRSRLFERHGVLDKL